MIKIGERYRFLIHKISAEGLHEPGNEFVAGEKEVASFEHNEWRRTGVITKIGEQETAETVEKKKPEAPRVEEKKVDDESPAEAEEKPAEVEEKAAEVENVKQFKKKGNR